MNIFRQYTMKSLKKNRTRTIVTIIGIILSVAMITAVTTTVSSMQDFMLRIVEQNTGSWHGVFYELPEESAKKIVAEKEVDKSGALQNVGYARLKDSQNHYKQYLYIGAYTEDYENLRPIYLVEGRKPQNSSEIILPKFLQENGGIQYKTGDMLTLDVGIRKDETGTGLWQLDAIENPEGEDVDFQSIGKRTYHVVGIYTGPDSDDSMTPGYGALTKADTNITARGETLYVTLHEPDGTDKFMKAHGKEAKTTDINSSYLTYSGNSQSDSIKKVMNRLMVILIGIIMFGSIALIYNSFSISVTERKKQYGLLSSIGATRKQLKRSVMFESVILSAIGIPLGILAGLGGMAVTFYFISDIFTKFFMNDASQAITLQLSASLMSIVIAAGVGFVTVLISAYLPARRALKISAIEAVRQADDIKVKPKKLRTSRMTQKLFGLEGMLASKNFKRNKRKYRATVFSLFISIVLFISASSFCDYMQRSISVFMAEYDCDLRYLTDNLKEEKKLYESMKNVKKVTDSNLCVIGYGLPFVVTKGQLTDSYIDTTLEPGEQNGNVKVPIDMMIVFVDEDYYEEYLDKNGFDKPVYMNTEKPTAIAVNQLRRYVGSMGKYEVYHAFNEKQLGGRLLFEKKLPEGYELEHYSETRLDKDGNPMFQAVKYEWEARADGTGMDGHVVEGSEKNMTIDEAYDSTDIRIGTTTDNIPTAVEMYAGSAPILLYPRGAMEKVCKSTEGFDLSMNFNSDYPEESYKEMCTILTNNKLSTDKLQNIDEMYQSQSALITLVRVFSFGFIILITMIAMANVFNTISTNVSLRRREFAMLRSVGMTQKGFYKMMNYECLLYGVKGIMYGVPVSIGMTALIYWSISAGIDQDFYVPWYSVVIAVGSVFVVVFATMLYSMGKIRKDNVVETLKNENY